jgi:GGDEF domain-containing protein
MKGGSMPGTISVGVAVRGRDDTLTSDELIERADKALYASKRAGRDRVTIGGR